jgi:4-hydroxybenzoate polyprenyltransferase
MLPPSGNSMEQVDRKPIRTNTMAVATLPPHHEQKTAEYLRTIFFQCIFYLLVVFLCLLAGLVANPNTAITNFGVLLQTFLHSFESQDVYSTAIATSIFFASYFIARLILIDRSPYGLTEGAVTASMYCAAFFYICFLAEGLYCYYHGLFRTFPLLIFVTGPCVIMFFTSVRPQRLQNHPFAHNFLPKTFFPAFSICYLCFCLGWTLANPTNEIAMFGLNKGEIIFCIFSFLIVCMFFFSYRDSANTPLIVAVVFTILLFATAITTMFFYKDIGLALFIAMLWSFALGVAEVAKRGHLIESGEIIPGKDETPLFFVAGANWSSILFFNLLLLMPVLTSNSGMLFVVGVAWTLILVWHAIQDKTSEKAYYAALSMGYVLPIAMILLFLLGKVPAIQLLLPSTTAHQTDRLITLLGIFLTIIFVLYHDRYRTMPLELRLSPNWFLSKQSCLLFAALTVAVEAVLLTMIFSILSVGQGGEAALGQIQFRVDLILVALIVELIFILVLLFVVRDDGSGLPASASKSSLPLAPGSAPDSGIASRGARVAHSHGAGTKTKRTNPGAICAILHPLNSSIAGALSFVLALQRPEGSLSFALDIFLVTTVLCMFGYVANDLFDVQKDRLANRADKPIVAGSISFRLAVGLASGLALISFLASVKAGADSVVIIAVGLLLCLGYSLFSRTFPKLKGLYTGVLCCIPVVVGAGLKLSIIQALSFLLIVIFVFGREIVIDVTDMRYDRSSRHDTIALFLGADRAVVVGWLAMLSSAPLIFFIQTSAIGRALALAAIGSLFAILIFGFRDAERSVSLSRIPMLLTIGSFLFVTYP